MNSENSKTSKPHVLTLKLTSKLGLRLGEKFIALSNLSIYYTWRNIKSSYNNNKFKISAPTWNDNCNWTRTQNHLNEHSTIWPNWPQLRVQLQSLNLQISCLLRASSSLTFRQLYSVDSL